MIYVSWLWLLSPDRFSFSLPEGPCLLSSRVNLLPVLAMRVSPGLGPGLGLGLGPGPGPVSTKSVPVPLLLRCAVRLPTQSEETLLVKASPWWCCCTTSLRSLSALGRVLAEPGSSSVHSDICCKPTDDLSTMLSEFFPARGGCRPDLSKLLCFLSWVRLLDVSVVEVEPEAEEDEGLPGAIKMKPCFLFTLDCSSTPRTLARNFSWRFRSSLISSSLNEMPHSALNALRADRTLLGRWSSTMPLSRRITHMFSL